MNINIITDQPFSVNLYGFSGTVENKHWKETGFRLMNKLWESVKTHNLKNKGLNTWVYEKNNSLFAGVELEQDAAPGTELEHKKIILPKYVYYKHTGPYNQIESAGAKIILELNQRNIKTCMPYLEVYGHYTADGAKLETEMLWCLE